MSENEFYRFIQRMERELYGNASYLFAGDKEEEENNPSSDDLPVNVYAEQLNILEKEFSV